LAPLSGDAHAEIEGVVVGAAGDLADCDASWDMPGYPNSQETFMSQATVGRWGKNLAIRVPLEVARRAGLADGERVEIEAQDGDIVIRRLAARARKSAVAAAEEIIAERRRHRLDRKAMRQLIAEGRRG
jgi:antitoxin component of MazEF toxin-antitoxin module